MASSLIKRKAYFVMLAGLMLLMLLAACGSATSSGSSSTSTSNSSNGTHVNATPAVTEAALIKEMTFVGSPAAKIVSGTTFEVDGKIKNGDDKQHDIYVKVVLLDAVENKLLRLLKTSIMLKAVQRLRTPFKEQRHKHHGRMCK